MTYAANKKATITTQQSVMLSVGARIWWARSRLSLFNFADFDFGLTDVGSPIIKV